MSEKRLLKRLADYVSREIPLTIAMEIELQSWQDDCLTVSAPLSANRNHKATAFGGSLYSLAVVAGWGLLVLKLWQLERDCDVVIQHAEVDYIEPVNETLLARCQCVSQQKWNKFIHQLERNGKARIKLEPVVSGRNGDALRLRADFVAIVRNPPVK